MGKYQHCTVHVQFCTYMLLLELNEIFYVLQQQNNNSVNNPCKMQILYWGSRLGAELFFSASFTELHLNGVSSLSFLFKKNRM